MPVQCKGKSGNWFNQLEEVNKALSLLHKGGLGFDSYPVQALYNTRGRLMSQLGLKLPKIVAQIATMAGLSPGTVKLWLDTEQGWFTEIRLERNGSPVHHFVSTEVALAIIKGELSHQQFEDLKVPDPYIGE